MKFVIAVNFFLLLITIIFLLLINSEYQNSELYYFQATLDDVDESFVPAFHSNYLECEQQEEHDETETVTIFHYSIEQEINMNEYLIGVLAGEVSPNWPCETLKAQAVVARTYAINYLSKNDYIPTTTAAQVYLDKDQMIAKFGANYDKFYNILKNAVLATADNVITHNNKLIDALYFSTAAGYTLNSSLIWTENLPYTKTKASPWDISYSPYYYKEYSFSKNYITEIFGDYEIDVKLQNEQGYIESLYIDNKEYTATNIRTILGLRSPIFLISFDQNNIVFKVFGFGHQVGMSQYGAYGLGISGYSYEQIIKYYYNNVEVYKR